MLNRWRDSEARRFQRGEAVAGLGLRVYGSRLLGEEGGLVLHGGGNTSMKGAVRDVFGDEREALFVKGSGWDLRTIEVAGFPAVDMGHLQRLAGLDALSDKEMMRQLRGARLDPAAPTPSVEAILHAIIPFRYVDHSHADAVVAVSNTAAGSQKLRDIYGDEVLIMPYLMPGFVLAKAVAEAVAGLDWGGIKGLVLMNHGVFTFHDEAKVSYGNMIDLVSRAEEYLKGRGAWEAPSRPVTAQEPSAQQLSILRREAGGLFGGAVLVRLDRSPVAAEFAARPDCGELIARGPLTPDHTIHAKAFGAVFEGDDPAAGLSAFAKDYKDYFAAHHEAVARRLGEPLQCLDPMPRYGVWPGRGVVYLAANPKRLRVVEDISRHTLQAIGWGEALGGWQALPRRELFEVEYWELEQAKLKSAAAPKPMEGKVVLVTGAASGIGWAAVAEFLTQGAVVAALDIKAGFGESTDDAADDTAADTADAPQDALAAAIADGSVLPLQCDVTDAAAVQRALTETVLHFGGIDVLVSNAGVFPPSQPLAELRDADWEQSLGLNLSAHMRLLRAALPYLEQGFGPAAVIVASKNVPAPGPGAAAYSAAKAGLTQLARVAALELGGRGIRVNTVHPNAVYDTGLWNDEVLAQRAAAYGKTVEEYKTANVLGTGVRAADVARAIRCLADDSFPATTGAQVPVDGGNERVI